MNIFLLISLLVMAAATAISLTLLLKSRHSAGASAAAEDERMLRYEQSTRMLLDQTRRQYEEQITRMQQQMDATRVEMEMRMERRSAELRRQTAAEFAAMAAETLAKESDRLHAGNRMGLNEILTPLRDKLSDFQQAVSDSYVKENASRRALSQQIETLARANSEIGMEARRLSDALRGNAQMQGRWGEMVLQRILEDAGMIRDIHFVTQSGNIGGTSIKGDEGEALRPDVVLLLPGDHRVVVDSKTSLTSYLRYAEAPTEKEAEIELRRHVASTRAHIDELAARQYHKSISGALQHTLMFMPNDASYLAALRGDASLTEYALKNNVVIVAPAHLLSVVQLISQLWRVEKQDRNARAIAKAAGQLYDKFVTFISDFESIDRNLQASSRAYEKCLKHITNPTIGLSARAEKLRDMGASATKRIPEHLRQEPAGQSSAGIAPMAPPSAGKPRSEEEEAEAHTEVPVGVRTADVVGIHRQ